MKQLPLTLTALLACVSFASAEINTFTGYGQGTAWESYTDQQQKAGFLPGVKHKRVSLTAANMIAMYTTPVVLLAAPGTGKVITINKVLFAITRTSTAFTGGGAAIIQYDSTANGGGTNACDSTLASTVITGSSGASYSTRNGAVISDSSAIANKGIYISNATAVFAAGTGTAVVDLYYTVD
jgi:hypothetical protein